VSFNCFHDDEEDILKIADGVRSAIELRAEKFQDVLLVNCQAKMVLGLLP
jgi:hypothetical protein